MKLCKDCKHYQENGPIIGLYIPTRRICLFSKYDDRMDLVTGQDHAKYIPCKDFRGTHASPHLPPCGVSARHFEPRPTILQTIINFFTGR